jgi:hypothetical protein
MTMKKLANLIPLIMIVLILQIMAGCSGGGSESGVTNTNSETSEKYGAAIPATSKDAASTITLLKDTGTEDGFVITNEGELFDKGTKVKFGIRVEGGSYPVEKVLVSDFSGDQINAAFNKDLKLYVCNFPISDKNKLIPVLIQAVHPNGQASKAKYVFTTAAGARSNQLVRDGLGVLIGKDILASAANMSLSGLTIKSLQPKEGHSIGIMEADLGVVIPVVLGISDGLEGNETVEVLPTLKLVIPILGGNPISLPIDMGIKTMMLDGMLGGMADLNDNGLPDEIAGLNLDKKPLYLDINGIPASTTSDMAALSMGLFMAEGKEDVFPSGVTLYQGNDAIDFSPSGKDASSIEISLSQVNMTQLVGEMLNGYVLIPALDIPTAIPDYKGVKPTPAQELKISFNKAGIAFDFSDYTDTKTGECAPVIILNDVKIEYLENKINSMWTMSLDLAFKLDAGAHQEPVLNSVRMDLKSFLDVYLTFIPELSSCTVMKDDMGITMFDKSNFATLLVGGLTGMFPINESDPVYDKDKIQLKLSIETGASKNGEIVKKPIEEGDEQEGFAIMLKDASAVSNAGRCFLKMATEKTDLKESGICFINTVNLN